MSQALFDGAPQPEILRVCLEHGKHYKRHSKGSGAYCRGAHLVLRSLCPQGLHTPPASTLEQVSDPMHVQWTLTIPLVHRILRQEPALPATQV